MKRYLKLLRSLLLPLSGLYWLFYTIDKAYKTALRKTVQDSTIISIGNITTGGTGKTPFTIFLARSLKGRSPVILTRGFRSGLKGKVIQTKDQGLLLDEPGLLATRSGCPVSIHPDRYEAAQQAQKVLQNIGRKNNLYVMDDGFQHYRLVRNMNIVLIDCTNPFGNGWLIPAGILREPLSALKRADRIILTRSESITENKKHEIMIVLARYGVSPVKVFTAYTVIDGIFDRSGKKISSLALKRLRTGKIFAFAGVGNFTAYIQTISKLFPKNRQIQFMKYVDHMSYGKSQLDILRSVLYKGYTLLTTEKDINKLLLKNIPCYSVRISMKLENQKTFLRGMGLTDKL